MKTKAFNFLTIAILTTTMLVGCSKAENVIEETSSKLTENDIQMTELIQYVRDINPNPQIHTRGFWSSFRNWFKRIGSADSGGYRWGRDNGLNAGQSLLVGVSASIINVTSDGNGRIMWNINNEWKVYPTSIRQHKEIGNAHNRAVYEIIKENPSIKTSEFSIDKIVSLSEKKVKAIGYNYEISSLQRGNIINMLRQLKVASTMSEVTGIFQQDYPNSKLEYQFLEEYLEAVTSLNDKNEAISFTENIYTKIDTLTGVKKSILKETIAIALCSINLWKPV